MKRVYERDEQGRRYYQLDEELETVASPFLRTDRAWTAVITIPIDMTDADSFRKKVEEESGVHVSITSLVIKAASDALEDFSILSGMWMERIDRIICPDSGEITIYCPVQVGDKAPPLFIEEASRKKLLEISEELNKKVELIKKGDLKMEFLPKPVFTITNVGMIGCVESGFAQSSGFFVSALAVGSILKKPVVEDDEVAIRKLMNVVLGWDHRAMMANTPIEFLNELKKRLEEPDSYLV
jgi:pyruvate/2-oxoglutarate dehydrogenase complex dihydrolipoamide acyltransferase (E2) component